MRDGQIKRKAPAFSGRGFVSFFRGSYWCTDGPMPWLLPSGWLMIRFVGVVPAWIVRVTDGTLSYGACLALESHRLDIVQGVL